MARISCTDSTAFDIQEDDGRVEAFKRDLCREINRNSIDAYLGIPDWVLASYIIDNLESLRKMQKRERDIRNGT